MIMKNNLFIWQITPNININNTQATRLTDNPIDHKEDKTHLSYLLSRSLISRRPNSLLIAKNVSLERGFVKISSS